MAKKTALTPEDVSSLKELISTEKARLRWRLGVMTRDESEPEDGGSSKIYRVFSACLGD